MTPVVLCVGGLDPAGRAGLVADVRAVEGLGGRALCVATALTFQSSRRGRGHKVVEREDVRRQLAVLLADERIDAVKLGQLASLTTARLLEKILPHNVPLVVDTPLATSSGSPLIPPSAIRAAYEPIVRRASLVTPNALEVRTLVPEGADIVDAAQRLRAPAVLLKGGHVDGVEVVDQLFEHSTLSASWRSERIAGRHRGTGCRLAAAIATGLGRGENLQAAISSARRWLVERLAQEAT